MKKLFYLFGLLLLVNVVFVFYSKGETVERTINPATVDEGVVVSGIRWATRNVDAPGTFAANPEDFGRFYKWGERRGWEIAPTGWRYSLPSGTTWLRVNDPCPEGWRLPTEEELSALRYTPYERHTRNGVAGVQFGTAPNQLFLPATGWLLQYDGRHAGSGVNGYYWSSFRTGSGFARYLGFNRYSLNVSRTNRGYGFSVRCVADE